MIMAALHTVNHNKLPLTRYRLLRQIKSGSEKGATISNRRTVAFDPSATWGLEWLLEPESSGNVDPQTSLWMRIMHTYEKAPGGSRQSPGYTGFFAIICLFASIFLVWALMRTSLVKTSLEMMSSPPVTTGMASNAPVNSVAKP
jgi:hypothetical protein